MSVQDYSHASLKVLVTGTSGTGKTSLWTKLIERERAAYKFVFDHQGEFSRRFGYPAVFTADGLLAATERKGWIVFDPVRLWPGQSQTAFEFFCDYVLSVSETLRGRKLFACDELQKLTGTRKEPLEFLSLLDTGRRFQVDVFTISQAPNRIHNAIRNQLTKIFTFRQSDANAIKYLAENGFSEAQVRALQKFSYLWRDLDSGQSGRG